MKLKEMLMVSRPILWIVFPVVFYIGLLQSGASVSLESIIIMLALSFPLSLAAYGINDVYDYKTDRKSKRKKGIQGYIVGPKDAPTVKIVSFLSAVVVFISFLLSQNILTILLGLVLIVLGYFYSALPLRLKERSPFDSLSNGFLYFFIPYSMGYSMSGGLLGFPISSLIWLSLCVSMIHALGSIVDYDVDKKAGLRTFAVAYGTRTTAIISAAVFFLTFTLNPFSLLVSIYLLFCFFISALIAFRGSFAPIASKMIYIGFLVFVLLYIVI